VNALTIGAAARHPSHGTGRVTTVARDWRGCITGAEVEFTIRGIARRLPCQARDLTVVDAARPALALVEPVVA